MSNSIYLVLLILLLLFLLHPRTSYFLFVQLILFLGRVWFWSWHERKWSVAFLETITFLFSLSRIVMVSAWRLHLACINATCIKDRGDCSAWRLGTGSRGKWRVVHCTVVPITLQQSRLVIIPGTTIRALIFLQGIASSYYRLALCDCTPVVIFRSPFCWQIFIVRRWAGYSNLNIWWI